jgi:hypothetical protein
MAFPAPEIHVRSWTEFVEAVTPLDTSWVFRGGLQHWHPKTTLERALKAWNIPADSAGEAERRLVRDFQRHPEVRHLGLAADDYLGWFALMQHHGAPTRLLDWTYSPFIAAFFAFDALFQAEMRPGDREPAPAAVWAINTRWLADATKAVLAPDDWRLAQDTKRRESFAQVYVQRRPAVRFVSPATPRALNDRLSIQQGVFLCPGDVSRSWLENLSVVDFAGDRTRSRSFILERSLMADAFDGLLRMNVTARSLLPGLDGYARSMNHRLRLLLDIPLSESDV